GAESPDTALHPRGLRCGYVPSYVAPLYPLLLVEDVRYELLEQCVLHVACTIVNPIAKVGELFDEGLGGVLQALDEGSLSNANAINAAVGESTDILIGEAH